MRYLTALSILSVTLGVTSIRLQFQIPQIWLSVNTFLAEFIAPNEHHQAPGPQDVINSIESTAASYWLEDIRHQGFAAFNPDTAYQVFRNVKDFGAKGDGVTDDTAAIQRAVTSGKRCAPAACKSSSITPAVVYFPAGTYNISSSIIFYYNTQIIGNPNNLPVLRAAASFTGFGVIDGNQYQPRGVLGFVPQNHFFSQIRNLIIDLTDVPSTLSTTGIHWPTSQTTSLQNIVFKLSDAPDTKHWGLFVESGSALFLNDLVFYGGLAGATLGNQQYTMRNITFYNAVTAINQLWDWGWLYKSLTIVNCSIGLDMSSGGPNAQAVGSVTLIDSYFQDTPVGISTSHNKSSLPPTAGSLIIENVQFQNVPTIIRGPENTVVLKGSKAGLHVDAWGQGHSYAPNGPEEFQGPLASPFTRPVSLVIDGKYYEKSKPSYAELPASELISTRSAGARGDGIADDTKILQELLTRAARRQSVVFFDAGTYKVTRTLFIPPGSRIVGEFFPVILSSGLYFADIKHPRPVVQVGHAGQSGTVQWSDMIVSTQGPQAGAVLIEWNLASKGEPSGMWDVHVRVGGFAGSELQVAQCPKTPQIPTPPAAIDDRCIASYMSMHITKTAANLYLENVWLWVADHDIDNSDNTQITIYAGRGLHIDHSAGPIWLYGTSSEHHVLYQYQIVQSRNIFAGQIQTETPYHQPNPDATIPFPPNHHLNDPDFTISCAEANNRNPTNNCASAWGLRILDSQNILVYGAGLYSFFSNYSTECSDLGKGAVCQSRIFSLEESKHRHHDHDHQGRNIGVYGLNTIGATNMISREGETVAAYRDNVNVFPGSVAVFKV